MSWFEREGVWAPRTQKKKVEKCENHDNLKLLSFLFPIPGVNIQPPVLSDATCWAASTCIIHRAPLLHIALPDCSGGTTAGGVWQIKPGQLLA